MGPSRAAARYALALLGTAEDRKELETVANDVETLGRMIAASADFALFLRSPVISTERKRSVLREILGGGRVGAAMQAFVLLLAQKDRESLLPEILVEFRRLRDERLGILHVRARSAADFTAEQKTRISERLGASTGKKVQLTVERDPSLIGGFTIQYEDTVWDASVRRQLEVLRERLTGGA